VKIKVECRCKRRTIDTDKVGPWRLRCKTCGEVLYDPRVAPLPDELEDSDVEDSVFQQWLNGSSDLNVLTSTDGEESQPCPKHPQLPVVAACTRCSSLLCKSCLDRVEDVFVCSDCIRQELAGSGEGKGMTAWLKRLFGG
jgi:hypothetical protein